MRADAGFLDAIGDKPEDDAPRLIYADWLDDHGDPARAAFIRVQCRLARLGDDDLDRVSLERQEQVLLAEHGNAWRKELPAFARKGAVFRRGFVEEVTADAAAFVKGAPTLFRVAPVQHAWLTYRMMLVGASRPDPELAACPFLGRLKSLKVGGPSSIGDGGVRTLVASPHLAGLQNLDLVGNEITADGMRAVAESPHIASLKSLKLGPCVHVPENPWAGDGGAVALASSSYLANLRELCLQKCWVGLDGIEALAGSPHLRNLVRFDLSWNHLGDRAGAVLAGASAWEHLAALDLNFTILGNEGAEALLTSRRLPRLTDVDLGCNAIELDTLARLLAGPAGSRLTRLALGDSRLGNIVIPVLAPLRLWSLDLHTNLLAPGAGRLLADLPLFAGLRELDLGSNQLGDEDVQAIAESPRASSLRVLDLSGNNIKADGARALAASPHLARLRVLNLHHNKVGDSGAHALIASPHLTNLRRLLLHHNGISKGTKEELKKRFGTVVQ
jgi:uncharacterized protein (TIGR02996 family)